MHNEVHTIIGLKKCTKLVFIDKALIKLFIMLCNLEMKLFAHVWLEYILKFCLFS